MMTSLVVLKDGATKTDGTKHRCEPCNLQFTRLTLERHLAQDHRLDPCRICSKPVLTYQVTPLGASLDFCSGACVAEVRHRRLCFKCLLAYTTVLESYFCRACTQQLGLRISQFAGVVRTEIAMNQARWLPSVYQRNDPNAWKLLYIRKEDVA